jgi:hypothetical protein
VSVWDSLKVVIVRLRDEQPHAMTTYPDPRVDRERRPPFHVGLAPWAADIARELHEQFGADVTLSVGAQPYPPDGEQRSNPHRDFGPLVDPARIGIEPDGPLSVRSGHHHMHGLLLTNRTESQVSVSNNGHLTAVVVDPRDDRVVGGYTGMRNLPRVTRFIVPGATRRIPLLVGTASFDPALGYAVPPGNWAIRARIVIGRDAMTTPTLPLIVTE